MSVLTWPCGVACRLLPWLDPSTAAHALAMLRHAFRFLPHPRPRLALLMPWALLTAEYARGLRCRKAKSALVDWGAAAEASVDAEEDLEAEDLAAVLAALPSPGPLLSALPARLPTHARGMQTTMRGLAMCWRCRWFACELVWLKAEGGGRRDASGVGSTERAKALVRLVMCQRVQVLAAMVPLLCFSVFRVLFAVVLRVSFIFPRCVFRDDVCVGCHNVGGLC